MCNGTMYMQVQRIEEKTYMQEKEKIKGGSKITISWEQRVRKGHRIRASNHHRHAA